MRPSEPKPLRALCVSVHDVAPATWNDSLRLLAAVRAVADIPLTWLLVPRYHGNSATSHGMQTRLSALLEQGHELALHGYCHFDSAPRARSWRGRFLREVFTEREGEFAALDQTEARRRLELGLACFGERKWPVCGFVPPAWLLSAASWQALRALPFTYTTTFTRFHCLPEGRSVFSPSLVYMARNGTGRLISPLFADATAGLLVRAPLLRLSLHPRDARSPRLLRHAQRLLESQLLRREPMTKAAFAARLTSTGPTRRLHPSTDGHSPHTSGVSNRNALHRP